MSNISTRTIKLFALLLLFSTGLSAQFFTETFDGGLPATWTAMQNDAGPVNASSNWVYSTAGPTGSFPINPIMSTTAANGFMLYDSDLNCSGSQDVWLISPEIDCSSYTDVVLQFESYYRSFNDVVSIQVSNDGMTTWNEFVLFPNITPNQFGGSDPTGTTNPSNETVVISSAAAGQATVNFAFRFLSDGTTGANGGCAYSWMLDDVALTDVDPTPLFDMQANRNFYAIPPSVVTPASQVSEFGFLCDIENVGQMDATDVNLNVSITDEANQVLHSQDMNYGPIAAGTLDENRIFPDRYTPPATVGIYTLAYDVTMTPDDLATDNNTINFDFVVSDTTFAKELGEDLIIAGPNEMSANWTFATSYYVPNGDGFQCSSVSFYIGNYAIATPVDVAGGTINVTLYEWEDINDDGLPQASERGDPSNTIGGAIVGNASYTIQTDDQVVTLALENWDNPTDPVALKDDTQYILAVSTSSPNSEAVLLVGANDDVIDYSAMAFLHDSLDIPRFDTYWNQTDISFSADFTPVGGVAPFMRMGVTPITVSIEDELALENKMEIFPNPASDQINFNLDLVDNFSNANIRITDVSGKVMMTRNYENIQKETFQYNVSQFAPGTYFLHFTSEEGSRAIRFIVSK